MSTSPSPSGQWHTYTQEELFSLLSASEAGLSEEEVQARLARYGANELPAEKGHPGWLLFVSQFANPLMYIMMAATIVSLVLGNVIEACFVSVVMVSNALVGFYQEHKANKSLQALKGVIRPRARVVRDRQEREIEASDIVPGDILVLRAGDRIPADGRIIEYRACKTNEASLTGESKPIEKNDRILPSEASVADRTNMVFMGTLVEEGSATAVVVETGMTTQYGTIVSLLKETPEEQTPLQKTVASLSKIVGIFITIVVGLITLEGYWSGHDLPTIVETALALFVSAIPEGLLPAITIVLVLGMRRILRKRGLVRRLAATETLGGVTVICTDKTGTLTEGNMEVTTFLTAEGAIPAVDAPASAARHMLASVSMFATDAYIENPGAPLPELVIRGNFTEQALLRMIARSGVDLHDERQRHPVVDAILFSSDRKYSASLRTNASTGEQTLYVLGAPEQVLVHVTTVLTEEGPVPLAHPQYAAMIARKDELVQSGFRVVACASRTIAPGAVPTDLTEAVRELCLAGFLVIADPIRADVPASFQKTKEAGIRTVIITGDHLLTARAIAAQIGFLIEEKDMLDGNDVEALSDEALREKVAHVALYARVAPRHKLRIVHALQQRGEVVAMFGDGVNDAPALKAADIGVAVDTNVDAAREVADIVLLDGGFATVVKAIEQGRIIFTNIRKVFLYLITQDFSQFFIFIVAIFLGLPLPLAAAQLLLVNLVESGLPDLALTTEQEKEGLMQAPPRDPRESILNRPAKKWMIGIFAVSGLCAMAFYAYLLHTTGDLAKTRTMLMALLCLESLFLVFSVRSFTKSIFRRSIFSNKVLTGAVIISAVMIVAAVYLPSLQRLLATVALSTKEWLMIIGVNFFEIILIDAIKRWAFRTPAAPSVQGAAATA